jgi:hypothetical protein
MNKLERMLSADRKTALTERAKIAVADLSDEGTSFLTRLEKEKRTIEKEIINLTDIGPNSTTSLRINNINAEEWYSKLHKLKMDLRLKEIEIKVSKEINIEWFESTPDETSEEA